MEVAQEWRVFGHSVECRLSSDEGRDAFRAILAANHDDSRQGAAFRQFFVCDGAVLFEVRPDGGFWLAAGKKVSEWPDRDTALAIEEQGIKYMMPALESATLSTDKSIGEAFDEAKDAMYRAMGYTAVMRSKRSV